MHLQTSHQLSLEEIFKLNLESVNYLFVNDNQKQGVYNAMVSWYYHYVNENEKKNTPSLVGDGKCKFMVLNHTKNSDNVNTTAGIELKELCNKIRGQKCAAHY